MPEDSGGTVKDDADQWIITPHVKQYNPLVSGAVSMVIPGAGQLYTKHYIKSGTFVASQAISGYLGFWWNNEKDLRQSIADAYKDSADIYMKEAFTVSLSGDSSASSELLQASLGYQERAGLQHHSAFEAEARSINAFAWAIGVYVYNIFDAVGSSNAFIDQKERNPLTAGWLAAIPVLGLGQLYNGAISKAGMVMMAQTGLGIIAINYDRLMKNAEENYINLNSIDPNNSDPFKTVIRDQYSNSWKFKRDNAFQSRNTYLWYSIFFYFYSIFDAVVDAHLHDYPVKMKIEPDLVPQGGVSLGLSMDF